MNITYKATSAEIAIHKQTASDDKTIYRFMCSSAFLLGFYSYF